MYRSTKNKYDGPILNLICPNYFNNSMFPITVEVHEVDITATGESQTVCIFNSKLVTQYTC